MLTRKFTTGHDVFLLVFDCWLRVRAGSTSLFSLKVCCILCCLSSAVKSLYLVDFLPFMNGLACSQDPRNVCNAGSLPVRILLTPNYSHLDQKNLQHSGETIVVQNVIPDYAKASIETCCRPTFKVM